MKKLLKGKKILITAGPAWVPIDKIRIITSIFGGALGLVMALTAQKMGAKVILLLGPGRPQYPKKMPPGLRIARFKYFKELFEILKKEIGSKKYDAVIHSAAVPDYAPRKTLPGKIKSGRENLTLKLIPTLKIVDQIKKWDPSTLLVKFKLEVGVTQKTLIKNALHSMSESKADVMVANDLQSMLPQHKAFIIDSQKNIQEFIGKDKIAEGLLKTIALKLKRKNVR